MIATTRVEGDLVFVTCPGCRSEFEAPFSRFDPPRLDRHSCGATVLFQAECASSEHQVELIDAESAPARLQKMLTMRETLQRMLAAIFLWKEGSHGEKKR